MWPDEAAFELPEFAFEGQRAWCHFCCLTVALFLEVTDGGKRAERHTPKCALLFNSSFYQFSNLAHSSLAFECHREREREREREINALFI